MADAAHYFLVPKGPCQVAGANGGECEKWQRCKDYEVACQAYAAFVLSNGGNWRELPRHPDAETYAVLFSDKEQVRGASPAQPQTAPVPPVAQSAALQRS